MNQQLPYLVFSLRATVAQVMMPGKQRSLACDLGNAFWCMAEPSVEQLRGMSIDLGVVSRIFAAYGKARLDNRVHDRGIRSSYSGLDELLGRHRLPLLGAHTPRVYSYHLPEVCGAAESLGYRVITNFS